MNIYIYSYDEKSLKIDKQACFINKIIKNTFFVDKNSWVYFLSQLNQNFKNVDCLYSLCELNELQIEKLNKIWDEKQR